MFLYSSAPYLFSTINKESKPILLKRKKKVNYENVGNNPF